MKRILVTGATGGLGRNAVRMLLQAGIEVRACGRNTKVGAMLTAAGARFVALDLSSATLKQATELMQDMDAVWHCAALSSPWGAMSDFIAANVKATQCLSQAAGHGGCRSFVHISTPAVYFDYTNHFEIKEFFRPATYVNAYAQTKAQAELCIQATAKQFPRTRYIILRPRAIFGPYDQVLMPRLLRVLDERHGRLPLPRGGNVVLDMTYVENVVHAMWHAACSEGVPSGSVFNITNQEPVVLRDFLRRFFVNGLRRPLSITGIPYPLLAGAARCMEAVARLTGKEPMLTSYSAGALGFDMTLDNCRARDVLGYTPPITLSEGIVRTAEWIRSHG